MASKYVKKSHLEHILDRPDTYIGSCESLLEKQWVLAADTEQPRMECVTLDIVPGLFKIFDEILNNAIDQSVLDTTVDNIRITVTDTTISITNTGAGIPIEMHDVYNVHVPELIFGNLLTSSNYNDAEERITGGRNGYGAKLANIFSHWFEVEIVDITRGLLYKQRFEKNMTVTHPPIIKVAAKSVKKGYVKITFQPELTRFTLNGAPMTQMTRDMVRLFEKRAYDAAACTRATVAVHFNDRKIPIKTFDKYVDLFLGGNNRVVNRAYERVNDRWEVCVAKSDEGFQNVSFVNGICTSRGGTHVAHVLSQVLDKLRSNVKKASDIRPYDLKERIFLFVNCTLVNPTFTSQTKEECASRVNTFGSKCDVTDELIKKVAKLGIIEDALDKTNQRTLAKNDGAKRNTVHVPKLEDANKAGTTESHKCTLILTEGDSAKTFAIAGLSEVNRNYWGVFPLKGKLLNVRDASPKQIAENSEICNLKTILGLQHGKVYTDVTSLRYGKVMVLTDADVDGHHIKGLVLNFFHHFWPSLVKLNYVCTMNTPVVKVFKGNNTQASFYSLKEYKAWKDNADLRGLRIKYYKGLGTSTSSEAKEYFRGVTDNTVTFREDAQCNDAMELAFRKTLANRRKDWVTSSNPEESSIDAKACKFADMAAFINKDLVLFSMEDVVRSIPNVMDGLKPSQRKVLFACLKRNLKQEIRVSQLAGYVSEVTSYHHGEASLCGTITSMAQTFVGSNNCNVLAPIGQFGSRLAGGKDASSPRYIFTRLEPYVSDIFRACDDSMLTFLDDDGTSIEPAYYVPAVPMILINGAEGIGTGYSTSIPCYKISDIVSNIERFMASEPMTPIHPWYKGFKGDIRPKQDFPGTYEVSGVFHWTGKDRLEVTELPISVWTNDYKEWLEKMPWVHSLENHSTEKDVLFKVRVQEADVDRIKNNTLKELGLVKTLHTNNMHLFDPSGKIKKYNTPLEILEEYCRHRMAVYVQRKASLIKESEATIHELTEKARFIQLVVSGQLEIFKKQTAQVKEAMRAFEFTNDALLETPLTHFTQDKIDDLLKKCKGQQDALDELRNTEPAVLWKKDLDVIREHLGPNAM